MICESLPKTGWQGFRIDYFEIAVHSTTLRAGVGILYRLLSPAKPGVVLIDSSTPLGMTPAPQGCRLTNRELAGWGLNPPSFHCAAVGKNPDRAGAKYKRKPRNLLRG